MKKLMSILCVSILSTMALLGCGADTAPGNVKEDKVQIVCTTFPQYDWVMQLLGPESEHAEVTLLVQNNSDIHNYQPSTKDIIFVKEADLFIYVGGESEAWVTDLLTTDTALQDKALSLMDILLEKDMLLELGGYENGAEVNDTHDHDHGEGHSHEHDEHVWLSLQNARVLCEEISEKLCDILPESARGIQENTTDYLEALKSLDAEYAACVAESARNPLVFGDRFPFSYLAKDYNLEYYAAYIGCSAEVEVGFDTIIDLAEEADAHKLSYILIIDGSDGRIANTILNTTKDGSQKLLTMDSMQSVSMTDIQQGATYLDIMEENLEVLKLALGA